MLTDDFILIVEDTHSLASIYEVALQNRGYQTRVVGTGVQGLELLNYKQPQAILLDLNLPDISGFEILSKVRAAKMNCAVIVITGEKSIATAVDAMQRGADDFVAKPVDPERLLITLANAIEKRQLQQIVNTLHQTNRDHFYGFIGKSADMQAVYRVIENAAASQASVMIQGESGTGKELAARAIHRLSARGDGPFVALNCAAIPHELLESEIFGHVKGAFTGATADRNGAAWRASGGTLFLDELTEMPIALQSKLLRFIQEGVFTPVGSGEMVQADIRFVCATNRNPYDAIHAQVLREDLYYRLAVIPIEMPPLRNRVGDVLLLAEHFLTEASAEEGKSFHELTDDAAALLQKYRWPGNVRELENVIRHAVVMHHSTTLTGDMLSMTKFSGQSVDLDQRKESAMAFKQEAMPLEIMRRRGVLSMRELERHAVKHALSVCKGNITEAARRLEINPATIHRKLKAWKIEGGEDNV